MYVCVYSTKQILRDPDCTLWRGVAEDLEGRYREKLGRTVVFWGFTSTTRSMDALDAFIPQTSQQVTAYVGRHKQCQAARAI